MLLGGFCISEFYAVDACLLTSLFFQWLKGKGACSVCIRNNIVTNIPEV